MLAVLLLSYQSVYATADFFAVGNAEVAPNIAEIFVTDTGVRIRLEVFPGDVGAFRALLSDDWLKESARKARAPHADRMVDFSRNGLSLRRKDGTALPVTPTMVEARLRVDRASPLAGRINPLTGLRIPKPPEDKRVVFVELFYDFEGLRPDSLTFSPPQTEDGDAPLTIGMIVFDRDVPVTDYRFLPPNVTLHIDWRDPWFTRFENPNLMRHHRYPMMTFLYAEPYEIRHEALLRVRDAAVLAGVPLSGAHLSAPEVTALSRGLPDALNDASPMTVDGEDVRPDFERMQYLRIGPRGLEYVEDGIGSSVDATLIGMIYSHPTNGLAKKATLKWSVFPDPIDVVPGNAIDKAGPFLANLTEDDPVMVWTNHFKTSPYPKVQPVMISENPRQAGLLYALVGFGLLALIVSFYLARRGSALSGRIAIGTAIVGVAALVIVPVLHSRRADRQVNLSEPELVLLSEALLNNIYRAFDFKLEDQVYDRLALTLDGGILEQVYLDQRRALRVERAGGASARVDDLEVTAVKQLPSSNGLLRVQAEWTISGRVGHWGHTHRRTNTYRANLMIAPHEGAWKIDAFDVLSQERLL